MSNLVRNKKCPRCGRTYSSSYRSCPYCSGKRGSQRSPLEELLERVVTIFRQHGERIFLVSTAVFLTIAILGVLLTRCSAQKEKKPADDDSTQNQQTQEQEPPPAAEPMTLSQTTLTLLTGETARLTASGGSGDTVWSSSDDAVAEVADGLVTAKGAGTATITAACGLEKVSCSVTVELREPDVEVYLNRTDFTLRAKDPPFQMKVKVKETKKDYEGKVVWSSGDTSVVTISETGLVERVGRGRTTVTATMGEKVLECIVRVP